jgi:hypothetical protein
LADRAADRCRRTDFSSKQPLLDPGFGVICKVRIPEPWCFGNRTLRPPLCCNTSLPLPHVPHRPVASFIDSESFFLLHDSTVLRSLSFGPNAFVYTGRSQHARIDHHLNREASRSREIRKARSSTFVQPLYPDSNTSANSVSKGRNQRTCTFKAFTASRIGPTHHKP